MKRFECRMLAVKVVLMSVFGLFSLPSLAVVMQWIDSQVGFSGGGSGYFSESMAYIVRSPLIYLLIILCVFLAGRIGFLILSRKK